MKDIIPTKKESPILGLSGMGGGVGSNLVAGGAGDKIYIDDVFAVDRWKGNDSVRNIANGLDLAEHGGVVFIKSTDLGADWVVGDSVIGDNYTLCANNNSARDNQPSKFRSMKSTGFQIGGDNEVNSSSYEYVSYSFRKCEKFFDIVSFTGTGSVQNVPHNLGCVPGAIIVKSYSVGGRDWNYGHRMLNNGSNAWNYRLRLDSDAAKYNNAGYWNNTAPTDAHFTVGTSGDINENGTLFVAYLFAHEEASFGEDGQQKLITCGTYQGNDSSQYVNAGSEGQFTMIKNEDSNANWYVTDKIYLYGTCNAGGSFTQSGSMLDARARAFNINNSSSNNARVTTHADGFQIRVESQAPVNQNGNFYPFINVYSSVGLRAKPPAAGTDAFEVSNVDDSGANCPPGVFTTGWPVHFALKRTVGSAGNWQASSVKSGHQFYQPNETTAGGTDATFEFDSSTAFGQGISNEYAWMWRHSTGFDCQWITGEGGGTYNHNLGQVPEMIWCGNLQANDWNGVGHHKLRTADPWNYVAYMNNDSAGNAGSGYWNNTAPTATQFTVGNNTAMSGGNNNTMFMLWCSVQGICKIDDYTGDGGSSNAVNCGFQPRYVMIKRVDASGDWKVWDYARSTNMLRLNLTNAQVNDNLVSFTSTGFTLISPDGTVNANAGRYIYHAQA